MDELTVGRITDLTKSPVGFTWPNAPAPAPRILGVLMEDAKAGEWLEIDPETGKIRRART